MNNITKTDECNAFTKSSRTDIYQEVTDIIIQQLEKGTIPWLQPWEGNNFSFDIPQNSTSGKNYRGINIILLWVAAQQKCFNSNEWATFKQWSSLDQSIRKGEKGSKIVFFDTLEREDENGEIKKIPYLKQSVVFNKTQLVDFDPKDESKPVKPGLAQRVEKVEAFIANTGVIIEQPYHQACYNRLTDKVCMPDRSMFVDTLGCSATEGYYATLLHEMTHWTGHTRRLNRIFGKRFGDKQYAVEELVAELGAAFTCTELGISRPEKENHAAYIANWLNALRENKYFVLAAASEASKASEYLHKLQPA